ncbi:MAG: hypothetical protein JNK53_05515 [Phycisphaerae bacterium]|nr:hypothetical protein [Phycisphaerae bacterium]
MEHRARVLDVAAFLDRLDRAQPQPQPQAPSPSSSQQARSPSQQSSPSPIEDFRVAAFRKAVAILGDGQTDRARRVLELLSDPSTEPIAAAHSKGATGAFDPKGAHAS